MTKSYLFAGENKSRWICYSPTSAFIWASADKTPIHGDKQPTVGVEAQKKKKKRSWWRGSEIRLRWHETSAVQKYLNETSHGCCWCVSCQHHLEEKNKALYDFKKKMNFSPNVWCRRVEKIKRARKIQTTQQDKNCRNDIRTNFRQLPDCPTPVPRPLPSPPSENVQVLFAPPWFSAHAR